MLEKSAREITKTDIDSLIANGQREEQRLDYKESFPPRGEERSDFIRHVVGMANTTGGCIVIGVKEKRDDKGKPTGEPEGIHGLSGVNLDDERLRLASAIRDSITPRIVPEPELVVIETDVGPVVVIRVRRSLTKPHMFGQRFYARHGAQTLPLEVEQVRAEFLESEALPQRLRDFRAERLAEIVGGEASTLLARPANMIVHVCPLEAFTSSRRVDTVKINQRHVAPPGRTGGFTYRLTFSGAMSFSGEPGSAREYLLVFRNGCVEFATTEVVDAPRGERTWPLFRVLTVANILACDIPSVLEKLGEEVVPFPAAIMVTFLGTRGAHATRDGLGHEWTAEVREERALLQELILQDKPADWGRAMKETLDSVWQAVGLERCSSFDEHGRFVRRS